jgi:hypothetical protein
VRFLTSDIREWFDVRFAKSSAAVGDDQWNDLIADRLLPWFRAVIDDDD